MTSSSVTPLSEKPLPSPPVAQVSGNASLPVSRSLLDASEKPLRRSPPGMPQEQEDWPALIPQKSDQLENLPVLSNTAPSICSLNERYPILGNVSHTVPMRNHNALTTAKSARLIKRKEVPSLKHPERSGIKEVAQSENAVLYDDESKRDFSALPDAPDHPDTSNIATGLLMYPDLSASAAAVEKSEYEARSVSQPRQTRTSSLRARLSAGQLVKVDAATKPRVVGFTDFTVYNDSAKETNIHGLRAPKPVQGCSVSPHSKQAYGTGSSKESLPDNQAPAQLLGSSQIPAVNRRASRSSLHSNRPAPSPYFTPQRTEQSNSKIPEVSGGTTSHIPEASKVTVSRRSSIPVFRHAGSGLVLPPEKEKTKLSSDINASSRIDKHHSNEIGIFESCSSGPWLEEAIGSVEDLTKSKNSGFAECVKTSQQLTGLEAIEESPKQAFHIKRLSLTAPNLGPILKIATSAERVLMGPNSNKENQPDLNPKRSMYNRRMLGKSSFQQTSQSTTSLKTMKRESTRPYSSQGLRASTQSSSMSKEVRERKAKSADLSNLLPTDHLRFQSTKPKSWVPHVNSKASLSEDPFFDARSSYGQEKTASEVFTVAESKHISESQSDNDEDPWISPISYEHDRPSKNIDLANTVKPVASDYCYSDELHAKSIQSAGVKFSSESIGIAHEPYNSDNCENTITVRTPSTPQKEVRQGGSGNSSSFPLRSSSCAAPLDYTTNGSRKNSPISPLATKNSEAFLARQNQLGASKGLASAQLDLEHGFFKRDSAAQDSSKLQGSLSKAMFSNLRGLFHRRNADQDSLSPYRFSRKSKQKVSVGGNGSPFPSTSEIHPIYRPTLCPTNRSVIRTKKSALDINTKLPKSPAFASPLPTEISTTTSLALQLFESVRTEKASPKKERSLTMGTILVEAITQAREAEKAVEEARKAAMRAEMAHCMCKKTVADLASRVQEWKDEMDQW